MKVLAMAAAITLASGTRAATADTVAQDDPFLWLEDWHGEKSMAWVEAENARTVNVLQNDPNYPGMVKDAIAIATATDRIPMPSLIGGRIYNFWRDAAHPQGIWRHTSASEYAQASPRWTTALDLDALSKAEAKKWVWKGATCLEPDERRCLISLSDGGEDATDIREFDLTTGAFVKGGFVLSTSKQGVDWVDADTLIASRDWGEGTLTASGYPFVVKTLKRGAPLSDATEVFRGAKEDVGVWPAVLNDGAGNRAVILVRSRTFFENDYILVTPQGVRKLPLPAKSTLSGMIAGRVILKTSEPWRSGGVDVPTGSAVAISLDDLRAEPTLVPQILFAPGARQSVEQVATTRDHVILATTDNVRGSAAVLTPTATGWTSTALTLPDNASIGIAAASDRDNAAYLSVTGFLQPTTLWQIDAAKPAPVQVKALPARFDASGLVVEQFEASSTDGTKIPYFIVHREGMARDGSTPTIMTAYGGFEVSYTPSYSALIGKLWLERGGSFVVANIRGGGEFGPAWHQAGLKTKRQIIYDDFAAVGRDIFARKLSSPKKFGIFGGSNGGLLMGVEFNQHPELWNAVVIQVPLLDMLRFEQIAAGPSWVDEYGSVSVPEEKAFLETISPYHNVVKGKAYPEPYIWTTTKDDRVGPQHARKFAARLKDYGIPYLFYEDTAGGHSGDADIEQSARLKAMEMVYFTRKLVDGK
ncbi:MULTISPECIES: prolyl oligopeptidase family serine peptidase [unclassified Sphingobium]|uniref:prolyl oligopeptidase family serine peptidase n=1 Tax=unclassified Sphingobium TaxID=2611147 RepID=UPI002225ACE8|nr:MULTISPECIES: prolyl oligopeptidase family serine peptidase [unclassified Sphingobium]MCW2382361.1 prolyl oligopeptidase [Sphingobium sp. B2D3B]MCW2397466.1 prolyl oligopeptidase [Sphingobium sp. B2D3C]